LEIREGLYYSKEHEWAKVEGDRAYVGITDYAQDQLGDIVFVELPDIDDELTADDRLGVIESVKAVADVRCPLAGRVVEVNEELEATPESVNQQPYEAWIAVLEIADKKELEDLMSAEEYRAFLEQL
jgi:glycine cleavage system H protein